MRIRVALFVAAAALAAGALAPRAGAASADRAAQQAALRHERALWNALNLRDYRFRLRVVCFCPDRGKAAVVTVRGGRPRGAGGFQKQFDTVPELFAHIKRALDSSRSGDVVVRYDSRRGFLSSASIDSIKLAIDDEIGWTVDRFHAL